LLARSQLAILSRKGRGEALLENVGTRRALAEEVRIKAACHNFGAPAANKERKKILVGSERWRRAAEFL